MKNIAISVSNEAQRQARIGAAKRATSLSRIAQHRIAMLPGIPSAQSRFPPPQTVTNSAEPGSPAKTSEPKPTLAAQSSAQKPPS